MIKIYEVMAIENNTPLFFLDHILRLKQSISQYTEYSKEELIKIIIELYKKEKKIPPGFNIKVTYTVEENIFELTCIKSRKPDERSYLKGVDCEIYKGERRDPLIKKENLPLQSKTDNYCKLHGLYDVLLENHNNEITEGSRSNFLLIRNETIITSPIGDALGGITRKKIFEVCNEIGLKILESKIYITDIKEADSLLLTGTSPEILPVRNCDDTSFIVNSKIINLLKEKFQLKKEMDYNLIRGYFYSD